MKEDLYLKTLEEVCDYIIGTSQAVVSKNGKGLKASGGEKKVAEDRGLPEAGGYPVMLQLKETTTTCEWCQETVSTPNLKVYSRAPGSSIWEGKCQDCKQKKVINKDLNDE